MYGSRLLHHMPCGIPRMWVPVMGTVTVDGDGAAVAAAGGEFRGWNLKSRYVSYAEIELCLYLQHVRYPDRQTFWHYNGGQVRPLKSRRYRADFCTFAPERLIVEMAECG